MSLLDMLLDNIYVVVPLLFIVYRLWKQAQRSGQSATEAGRPPQRTSSSPRHEERTRNEPASETGGDDTVYRSTLETMKRTERPELGDLLRQEEPEVLTERKGAPSRRTLSGRSLTGAASSRGASPFSSAVRSVTGEQETGMPKLSRQELRRAVIWSEVLGPPRSSTRNVNRRT
ncbi:hypothetical protein M6D81_03030 [Paenibacillus sp. J5C_2022]|uniref:hypothetical protein n=1 Tax=Paenibacillus sp. J5C2022 TaxID=2977129 RepID=UPI0021D0CF47|nr:hypothetical protein [Paenibacillus sp. J5C2022]MCU6707673.1 hypothetical protein [Paenibacillus sp. J5C2022]